MRGIDLPQCDRCAKAEVMRVARAQSTDTRMWVGLPQTWAAVLESRWAHLVGVGADASPVSDSQKFGDVARAALAEWAFASTSTADRAAAFAAFLTATRGRSVVAA